MTHKVTIPQSVVKQDHDLAASTDAAQERLDKASEALARHRWHMTLDPDGPRYPVREYARAVDRAHTTIRRYAAGYALFVERGATPGGNTFTINDGIRLAEHAAENQAFVEAIAEGSEQPVARVARGDSHRRREIVDRAKARAERRGTDAVDEARSIAAEERCAAESRRRRRAEEKERRSMRYVRIEGCLAGAQRKLTEALSEADGVGFDDEEMELLRDSIAKVRAVLDLIDLRMAGTPDIDWDAEMANLGGSAS